MHDTVDLEDRGLPSVFISTVELSKDLSVAKVYFSLLNPDADPQPAVDGLKRAAGFLRRRLGNELSVRHVPELRFVHDDSVAHSAEISRLINSVTIADPDKTH